MSSPIVNPIQSEVEQISGIDPLLYTNSSSTSQLIVVHLYLTVSPIGNASVGIPTLTWEDEFGARTTPLQEMEMSTILSKSIPLRLRAGGAVNLNVAPAGQAVWSVYSAVEVLSTT